MQFLKRRDLLEVFEIRREKSDNIIYLDFQDSFTEH